eukprot:4936060-Prymnesium_polylepis.1
MALLRALPPSLSRLTLDHHHLLLVWSLQLPVPVDPANVSAAEAAAHATWVTARDACAAWVTATADLTAWYAVDAAYKTAIAAN